MADPILVNQIISSLGLTGDKADSKRSELLKLSDDELNKILANIPTFKKTDLGSFSALENSKWGNKNVFEPSLIEEYPTDFSTTNSIQKHYSSAQQKELDVFLANFLADSATTALSTINNYNNSVGWLNVTDRAVNGFKVYTGQEDRIDLQNRMAKEQESAQNLQKAASRHPGAFESQIERIYGVTYNHQNVENLKNTSQEFTRVTAYYEKFENLKKGFDEVREIRRQELEYQNAKKYARGAAAASLKAPSPSSHEKFGQVLLDLCNGDQSLVNEYMQKLNSNITSKAEIEENLESIMKELESNCESEYKKALNNKTYSQYQNEYNTALKKVIGTKDCKETAKNFVENAKKQAAYAEIGLTIATSVLIPGSTAFKTGAAKLSTQLGTRTAANVIKGAMTTSMASTPAVLAILNAATSENGFTDEAITEIKEKFKNGMIYGGFGAYVSGPLGSAVEKIISKNPTAFSSVISKAMGATTETTADVLFDRMTSDLSFEESLKQNGVMNFGMMFAGGRLSKSLSKNLQDINVKQNSDGTFTITDRIGGSEIKLNDADALAGYLFGKGAEAASGKKVNTKTNRFHNITELETSFKNDGINYEVLIDKSGNRLVKVVRSNLEFFGKTLKDTSDYYQFDNNGKLVKSSRDLVKSKAEAEFIDFFGNGAARITVENSRAGKLFSGIPIEGNIFSGTQSYTLNSLAKDLVLKEHEIRDIQTSLDSLEKYPLSNNIDTRKLPLLEIIKSGYSDINQLSEYAPDCWHVSEFVRDYLTVPDTKLESIPFEKNERLYKILSNLDDDIKQKCKAAGVDIDNTLKVLRGDISLDEAHKLCSDEKLIRLAETDNGKINKYALNLVQKLKEYGCDNIPYILENSDGKYLKTTEMLNKIENRLKMNGLKIEKGYIRIDDETLKMDRLKLRDKYGGNIFQKLEHEAYSMDDLMNFYLIDKGKYAQVFHNRDILSVMDAAYGVRSLTSEYRFKYGMSQKRKNAAMSSLVETLFHTPNEDQRYAMGLYKGDMSDYIQEHANDLNNKEAAALTEYLNEQPLNQDIHVTREDQLGILANIKFDDNVTLEDVLRHPTQYADKILNQESLIGKNFINDRFMSTTVFSDGAFGNCPVKWDFEVKKGVGSAYLDVLGLSSEGEILLNKNCKITITDIDLSGGIANIQATVEPSTQALL